MVAISMISGVIRTSLTYKQIHFVDCVSSIQCSMLLQSTLLSKVTWYLVDWDDLSVTFDPRNVLYRDKEILVNK